MTAGGSRPDAFWALRSRAYWLPPGGTGNGHDALAWAPIADMPELLAFQALGDLGSAGIAGYAAPRDGNRPHRGGVVHRLWVDSEHYSAAEDVLRVLLTERRAVQ